MYKGWVRISILREHHTGISRCGIGASLGIRRRSIIEAEGISWSDVSIFPRRIDVARPLLVVARCITISAALCAASAFDFRSFTIRARIAVGNKVGGVYFVTLANGISVAGHGISVEQQYLEMVHVLQLSRNGSSQL